MFEKIPGLVVKSETVGHVGKAENAVGMSMGTSDGRSSTGDIVLIYNEEQNRQIPAEVVGFKDEEMQLMTYEATGDIASGSFVRSTRWRLKVPIGDFLKDRIINTTGRSINGRNIFRASQYYTVSNPYTNPLDRPPIRDRLGFEIKAISGLNIIGKGQRIGIFAGSGIGENTLMGMIAKNVKTDISVIALVGECGREVLEFVQKDLGKEGMKRSILAVTIPDQPVMLRMKCPLTAIIIAKYFRDQGFDVLLMMGSLACYATAQREIGLAIGKPPIARGYTSSTYAKFPKLLGRSGNFNQGPITRIYMVLVEGDDTSGPIIDTIRGILGGHIVLNRQLVSENHFPAIDIGASIPRLVIEIVDKGHRKISSRFHNILSLYQKNSDLISIGAYKKGTNTALDEVISKISKMNAFLQQEIDERFSYKETLDLMESIVG